MLKKSDRMTLEEATRLAILGKLPLKEGKEVKKESTTVTTTPDGLTAVETDDANIVIEPKENAAVDIGMGTEPVPEVPADLPEEPVADLPEEPIDDEPDDEQDEEFEESKKFEGKEPKRKVISKHDIKKIESKSHRITMVENRRRMKKTETIEAIEYTYIDTFDELKDFCWGSAAKSTLEEVERLGKEDELIQYLEDIAASYEKPMSTTELNDIVSYDDMLEQDLGLFDYADEDLDESKKVEGKKVEEGNAELFKKKINKTDIKKVENKEKVQEGEAQLFKKKINKTDVKKVESKVKEEEKCNRNCGKTEKKEEAGKEPKRNIINKVDLRKTESKKDLNDKLKTKVAEGLTKFVKESYKNGKGIKVEKVLNLTENKLYVKGKLVMENCTKDFTCKLVPVKENKSFRRYTIQENKLLKITEGKTVKGKSFNLIIKK